MKLIVGLGNPGKQYENNRHNIGYLVVDLLFKRTLPKEVTVTKTNVFMNESGKAVKELLSQYPSIPVSNLFIVHDDLDIPLGSFKIQKGRGPKEHKGILSIEEELGTADFWRVRLGVDNRSSEDRTPGDEYVLEDFLPEERNIIGKVVEKVADELVKIFK